MGRAAHTTLGRFSFLLGPIYCIGLGLPTPTFLERGEGGQRARDIAGEDKELHPKASLEHFSLRATLRGGSGPQSGDTSFTSGASVLSCASAARSAALG